MLKSFPLYIKISLYSFFPNKIRKKMENAILISCQSRFQVLYTLYPSSLYYTTASRDIVQGYINKGNGKKEKQKGKLKIKLFRTYTDSYTKEKYYKQVCFAQVTQILRDFFQKSRYPLSFSICLLLCLYASDMEFLFWDKILKQDCK